jgi:hypothetical protein
VTRKWRTFVCLAVLTAPALADETEKKRPVPVYTNEDLERVRPFRDETGVASVPASPPPDTTPGGARSRVAGSPRAASGERDEAWWRREAARVRERMSTLDQQAAELRGRIRDAQTREPWSSRRRRTAPSTRPLEARLAAIEERRRALEDDLLERARRAGALPGWLR